jgi:hypothetical protein
MYFIYQIVAGLKPATLPKGALLPDGGMFGQVAQSRPYKIVLGRKK